ncbi:hypothetical protein K8Q93_01950 [Candidatus Parcubacteria bacterium]|nr:hypothetical protein [Candidatus Parcubacteria bacterium]
MSEKFGGGGPEKSRSPEGEELGTLMEIYSEDIKTFRVAAIEFKKLHDLERLRSITEISPELYALFTDYPLITFIRLGGISQEAMGRAEKELTQDECENYKLRVAAMIDIVKVTSVLQAIEHSLPRERWLILWNGLLKNEYLPISMAIGLINGGKIRHE